MPHITYRNVNIPYSSNELFYKEVEEGKWEFYTFDAIDRFAPECSSFIDVGAWLGIFSYYTAAKYKVYSYAFECDPVSFNLLDTLENKKETFVHNFGLSSYNGFARLNTQSCFGNSESSMQTRANSNDYHLVKVMTFDSFRNDAGLTSRDLLIKVDIEGSEFDFLKGATNTLLRHRQANAIIIAFHPFWTPDLQSGIDFVVDNYFDVYNVECSVQPHVNISPDHFRDMLTNDVAHSFVFVGK